MEKTVENFEQKLNITERTLKSMNFEEVAVKTKLKSSEMKISLPKEIIEFISEESYFTKKKENGGADSLLLNEEKMEELKKGLEKKEIDLIDNPFIQDMVILKALLAVLGSINSKNDFTQMTTDDYLSNVEQDQYIDSHLDKSYLSYIQRNLELIFGKFKVKDLTIFWKAAKFLGVNLDWQEEMNKESKDLTGLTNPIYQKIKSFVLSKNKLLIVITPSNNFWIKSEKLSLGTKNYDKRLNNYSVIYYNWPFIQKFYDRIANHSRCTLAFLNSMVYKNLKSTIDCIPIQVKNFTPYIIFDQNSHDNVNFSQGNNAKPIFERNINKMVNVCKSYEGAEFNETNILILESEKDKAGNTKANMIPLNIFSEDCFTLTPDEVRLFDLQVDRILAYLEKLLDECDSDVRDYLANNPFN